MWMRFKVLSFKLRLFQVFLSEDKSREEMVREKTMMLLLFIAG